MYKIPIVGMSDPYADVYEFVDLMERIGFDLIKYYTHVYYRKEAGYRLERCVLNDDDMAYVYSGCWYGGLFFKWLFNGSAIPTNMLVGNSIYHGFSSTNREGHHFLIITTDIDAIIFNTYGGVPELIIRKSRITKANALLTNISDGDVKALEPLFGFYPNYKNMTNAEIELEEMDLIIPSKETIKRKITDLIDSLTVPEDREYLTNLRDSIQ